MKLIPNKLRQTVLTMVHGNGSGHIGGSFSIAEAVAYLYSNFNLIEGDGDKLVLSKGHSIPIVYAALYELGLISDDDLKKFRQIDSPLQGHPHKLALPYIHASTGSLGQGLSIAIGHAMGMRMRGQTTKSFCIIGDGESQEGQIWEALM
jgi:transketolase